MGLSSRKPLPTVIESAGIRYNQDSDFVELLNPNTGEWVQWEKSGVMINPIIVNVTTRNLDGQTVTCTLNGETVTSKFVGGAVSFTLFAEGNATIACGTYSKTIIVTSGGNYTVEITRTPATLTVTTTNTNGQVVTVTIDGETYTRTFANNKAEFTIYEIGNATIVCGTVTKTQTIASGGSYTLDLTRPYATLNLTASNQDGQTINVSVNGVSYTGAFVSGKCTITVYDFGTATITCNGVSKSQTVASGNTYSVDLSRPYATLNLTTENLDGEVITVSVGGASYTGTFANGTCSIIIYTFGTATVTCSEVTETITIADGGSYALDLTEVTAVYLLKDGVVQSGFTKPTTTFKYDSTNGSYFKNVTLGRSEMTFYNLFYIDDEMWGKVLYVNADGPIEKVVYTYKDIYSSNESIELAKVDGVYCVKLPELSEVHADKYNWLYITSTTGYTYVYNIYVV